MCPAPHPAFDDGDMFNGSLSVQLEWQVNRSVCTLIFIVQLGLPEINHLLNIVNHLLKTKDHQ